MDEEQDRKIARQGRVVSLVIAGRYDVLDCNAMAGPGNRLDHAVCCVD